MNNIIDISQRVRPAPTPEKKSVLLVCAHCGRATRHTFQKSEELESQAYLNRSFNYIYTCEKCGLDRVFGCVEESLR
jgi:hypothetical protein